MKKQYNKSKTSRWWLNVATFSLAALAAASATVWVLKLSAPAPQVQASTLAAPSLPASDKRTWVRLLGGDQAGALPAAALTTDISNTRFKLMGVVAGLRSAGYALIASDGKPAKPYRVGEQLEPGWVLKSVAPRSAELASTLAAPTALTLELPKPAP